MKRLPLMCAVGLIISPVLAGPEILPVNGVGYFRYDTVTAKITPVHGNTRYGAAIWSYTCDDIP